MSQSSIIYTVGFLLVVGGLAYGASLAGIPAPWIIVGVVVLVGIFIIRLSRKSPPTPPPSHP
jgi:hypothetical protein